MTATGWIVRADCLDHLIDRADADSIDLVYLDPPFASERVYSGVLKGSGVTVSFNDLWRWSEWIEDYCLVEAALGGVDGKFEGIRRVIGEGPQLAYLSFMALRLIQIHRVLKSTGSIYLHCDHAASHWLRVLLDMIFGADHFRNEIAWCYTNPGVVRRWFPRKHDTILAYGKGDTWTFNFDAARVPHKVPLGLGGVAGSKMTPEYVAEQMRRGKIVEDWWDDIPSGGHIGAVELTGYPTQKPIALLTRIIASSSNPGDIVLDPFCGSGTTLVAAERLDRQWIGIDTSDDAVQLARERVEEERQRPKQLALPIEESRQASF